MYPKCQVGESLEALCMFVRWVGGVLHWVHMYFTFCVKLAVALSLSNMDFIVGVPALLVSFWIVESQRRADCCVTINGRDSPEGPVGALWYCLCEYWVCDVHLCIQSSVLKRCEAAPGKTPGCVCHTAGSPCDVGFLLLALYKIESNTCLHH